MLSPEHLLVQVVPRLKPGRCGISDHAIALAHELEAAFGVRTAFVVLNSKERADLSYPVVCCATSELHDVCTSLHQGRPGAVLVHLSGYGYSPDGVPSLLAAALARVKADGRFRIAVYFHETFATGAPWQSAFWHSRRQRNAVRSIANLSDLHVTNTRQNADWLQQNPGAAAVRLLPVFSTVGEAQEKPAATFKRPVMAVFGLPGSRQRGYKQLLPLGKMLHSLDVQEILDIGEDCKCPPEISGVPVQRMGGLPAAEIENLLLKSTFGFLFYPAFCIAKSSMFAAYCAHGVIPVIAESFSEEIDGLRDGVHLVSPKTAESVQASGLERCSNAAWRWYSSHRLHVHAETYWYWLSRQA